MWYWVILVFYFPLTLVGREVPSYYLDLLSQHKLAGQMSVEQIIKSLDASAKLTSYEASIENNCTGDVTVDPFPLCGILRTKKKLLSDEIEVLHLYELHRTQNLQPISANEFLSPQKFLIANLRSCVESENFQCARPVMFNYFKNKNQEKVLNADFANCPETLSIRRRSGEPTLIDLDAVSWISAILASPGKRIASKFGHIMFAINFTDPKYNAIFSIYQDPKVQSSVPGFFSLSSISPAPH